MHIYKNILGQAQIYYTCYSQIQIPLIFITYFRYTLDFTNYISTILTLGINLLFNTLCNLDWIKILLTDTCNMPKLIFLSNFSTSNLIGFEILFLRLKKHVKLERISICWAVVDGRLVLNDGPFTQPNCSSSFKE